MATKNGFPLVIADNIEEIFNSLGIRKWKKIETSISAEDFSEADLADLDDEGKDFKNGLRVEVSRFLTPGGKVFKGFYYHGDSGTRIFTLLDGNFVPICGEFQHGCGEVVFDLPGGRLELGENPTACAKREFEEESGIILDRIICLGSKGMPIAARNLDAKIFSFIGIARDPLEINNQNLDGNEFLRTVLISLNDWLKLIDREMVQAYSASTTLLALRKLNRGFYGY